MTTAEKLALLDRLQKLHQTVAARHGGLNDFLRTEALEPFWHLSDFAFEQTAARIGCSWGNHLAWHAFENDWGRKRGELNGIEVRSNADFLAAVEGGES